MKLTIKVDEKFKGIFSHTNNTTKYSDKELKRIKEILEKITMITYEKGYAYSYLEKTEALNEEAICTVTNQKSKCILCTYKLIKGAKFNG